MICKKCGMEAMIQERSKLLFEGDTSPEEETKAYYIQKYCCRNPNCGAYGKEIAEKKVYLD